MRNIGQINPTTGVETGYDFYKAWTADDFPRVIAVSLQQQTPYFPDSYSVNSSNNGPYGDAFVQEVVPFLEQRFRAIGRPYARILEGASTSGWQSLALILRNPDFFGGAPGYCNRIRSTSRVTCTPTSIRTRARSRCRSAVSPLSDLPPHGRRTGALQHA